jgi:hypothetical protein
VLSSGYISASEGKTTALSGIGPMESEEKQPHRISSSLHCINPLRKAWLAEPVVTPKGSWVRYCRSDDLANQDKDVEKPAKKEECITIAFAVSPMPPSRRGLRI